MKLLSPTKFALDQEKRNVPVQKPVSLGLQCPVLCRAGWGCPSGLKLLTSALSIAESFEEKPVHTAITLFSKM